MCTQGFGYILGKTKKLINKNLLPEKLEKIIAHYSHEFFFEMINKRTVHRNQVRGKIGAGSGLVGWWIFFFFSYDTFLFLKRNSFSLLVREELACSSTCYRILEISLLIKIRLKDREDVDRYLLIKIIQFQLSVQNRYLGIYMQVHI